MAGRIIPLTKERDLPPDGSIIFPIRADLPDYGNPGPHLGGPWAVPGKSRTGQLGIGRPGETIELGGLLGCMPLGGDVFTSTRLVNAAATRVFASTQIPLPFVINHIMVQQDGSILTDVRFQLKVADDNDTTGGVDATGLDLFGRRGDQRYFTPPFAAADLYPNFLVREPNKFLKVILFNNDAANHEVNFVVDFVYQP